MYVIDEGKTLQQGFFGLSGAAEDKEPHGGHLVFADQSGRLPQMGEGEVLAVIFQNHRACGVRCGIDLGKARPFHQAEELSADIDRIHPHGPQGDPKIAPDNLLADRLGMTRRIVEGRVDKLEDQGGVLHPVPCFLYLIDHMADLAFSKRPSLQDRVGAVDAAMPAAAFGLDRIGPPFTVRGVIQQGVEIGGERLVQRQIGRVLRFCRFPPAESRLLSVMDRLPV